jgi:two-component system sensor histidine kinase CpxA
MRGLFFKIFAIFWLAQSLIFIISTALIVRQRFPTHNMVSEALDSGLQHDADVAFHDYENGGCDAFRNNALRHEPAGSSLLDQNAAVVCTTPGAPSLPALEAPLPVRIDGRQMDGRGLWLIPVVAKNGQRFEYVWFQPPSRSKAPSQMHDILRFAFPQMPVAIAVGGVTTFALVLLFSRPLIRLRKAARQLAKGNLTARVDEAPSTKQRSSSDEFQGLVHDFNHMAERLESLVGAQRLLLRDVSHELRSPLSRLSVALELAREDAAPELGQHLTRIEREAEKLNQLIAQLLTLSSMEAKEDTSTFKPVSLNRLCEDMLPDAEYEAQRRPCTVTLLQDQQSSVSGDRELLYRAIENVVRNAIRYTEAGSEVTIRVSEDHGAAMIEVNDCGPGIPEAELANVFRPFYRVDHARSATTGGFGVGLAITERAVRLHGGTIQALNRAQGGTSIRFRFPVIALTNRPHSSTL